jgi:hypothetical protein
MSEELNLVPSTIKTRFIGLELRVTPPNGNQVEVQMFPMDKVVEMIDPNIAGRATFNVTVHTDRGDSNSTNTTINIAQSMESIVSRLTDVAKYDEGKDRYTINYYDFQAILKLLQESTGSSTSDRFNMNNNNI